MTPGGRDRDRDGDGDGDRGVALVGYRGTGKSTVGRIVAARLGWPFADADREVEARAGRPIRAVFEADGEPAFRDLEAAALADLCTRRPLVLATGGGAVIRAANRAALRAFGFVAWLRADPATLADRLRRSPGDRPPLTAAGLLGEVAAVLAARVPLYREAAHAVIETAGLGPGEVAAAVVAAREQFLGR